MRGGSELWCEDWMNEISLKGSWRWFKSIIYSSNLFWLNFKALKKPNESQTDIQVPLSIIFTTRKWETFLEMQSRKFFWIKKISNCINGNNSGHLILLLKLLQTTFINPFVFPFLKYFFNLQLWFFTHNTQERLLHFANSIYYLIFLLYVTHLFDSFI